MESSYLQEIQLPTSEIQLLTYEIQLLTQNPVTNFQYPVTNLWNPVTTYEIQLLTACWAWLPCFCSMSDAMNPVMM